MSILVQGAVRFQSLYSTHCCECFCHCLSLIQSHLMTFLVSLYFTRMLLDLEGHQDDPIEMIDEYLEWASNESILSVCTASLENAWAAFAVAPNTWLGEICYYLAERPEPQCSKLKEFLVKQGIELIEKSIEATQKLPYAYMYAKKKRAKMNL